MTASGEAAREPHVASPLSLARVYPNQEVGGWGGGGGGGGEPCFVTRLKSAKSATSRSRATECAQ